MIQLHLFVVNKHSISIGYVVHLIKRQLKYKMTNSQNYLMISFFEIEQGSHLILPKEYAMTCERFIVGFHDGWGSFVVKHDSCAISFIRDHLSHVYGIVIVNVWFFLLYLFVELVSTVALGWTETPALAWTIAFVIESHIFSQ